MKKNLLTCLLITLVLTSKAQMWCAPGAEWHYGYLTYNSPGISNGYLISNYVNDSIINTVTYKKIKVKAFGSPLLNSSNFHPILLNETNNLVTLWTGNVDTLFNFNAAIGDKWLRVRLGSLMTDVTRRYVTVLDTGHVVINSVSLKRLVLSYQSGGWVTANVTNYIDTVYEKIGSIKYFLNPAAAETSTPTPDVSGVRINGTFRCYSDNNFALYQKNTSLLCTAVVGLNELNKNQYLFTVFPNPATESINVSSIAIESEMTHEATTIEITNALGQVVLTKKYLRDDNRVEPRLQINIETLPSGLYYLIFKTRQGTSQTKFVKL